MKKTLRTQRKSQKHTGKVPLLLDAPLGSMFSIVKTPNVAHLTATWQPLSHWATKARKGSGVLDSGGHVPLRWPFEAQFELFWPLAAKWLPECIWKFILSFSGLWWSGFTQAAHFKSDAP